jgi:DNA-binding NarL/FixJ family response regulator
MAYIPLALNMKVVLVDDHDVVRHGLKLLLSGWKHVGVIGSFATAEEMFTQCTDFSKVDLILLDEQLKGLKGSEALKRMRSQGIETPVILLSVEEEAILQKRIDGLRHVKVLNKTIAPETLRLAIQSFVKHGSKKPIDIKDPVYLRSLISGREMEFLVHLCHEEEYTYDQIAHIMGVHVRTVDGFRKSLFQKLNIRSKTGLVMLAIRNGWV